MRSCPPTRRRLGTLVLGLALLSAACSPADSGDDESAAEAAGQEQAPQNPIPEPEYASDDTVRLPIGMVSPAGHNQLAPIGEDGSIIEDQGGNVAGQQSGPPPHQTEIARTATFGCQDTISVVQTVPVVTDDPGQAALEYLLSLDSVTHGEPAFSNPLAISDGVSVASVEQEGDQVTVTLEGEPVARDGCETWRVAKQIETTARIATGADSAEIRLEDSTLSEHWGLGDDEPLQITEIQRD